jgi:hypothetical protein
MKNFCILHILLFLLLVLIYQCTNAQDYVITQKGDSVTGTIKLLTYGLEKKLQLTSGDKKKMLYSFFQVKSFVHKNEKYATVKGPTGYTFMKVIKDGYLSLYSYQLEKQLTYDGRFLQKKDGESIDVPNLTFKKHMTKFLQDCILVADRIDKGELGKRDLETIVDEYNNCIISNTNEVNKAMVQEKKELKDVDIWDKLEAKVKSKDFEGKNDALDMIKEIKNKIKANEKVPNFLIDGLKRSLANTDLSEDLQASLEELN